MKIKYVFFGLLISNSTMSFADYTNIAKIVQLRVDGSAEYQYFLTDGKWEGKNSQGTVTCNPTYVTIKNTVPGKKEILSVALAAKHSGTTVQFEGTCQGDYFHASYIINY